MKSLKSLRRRKMIEQGGRCHYCSLPMWDGSAAPDCTTQAGPIPLRCTAEHLRPRCEGGGNTADNIVAACWYCNTHRHRRKKPLSPEAHRARVQRRMASGKWLAPSWPDLAAPDMRPARRGAPHPHD